MSLHKRKISLFAFFLMTVFTVENVFLILCRFSLGVKGLVQNLILLMNPYSLIALILVSFCSLKVRKHIGLFYWRILINIFTLC